MKKVVVFLFLLGASNLAMSAVSGYHEGIITEIGYEAGRGLIRIDKNINESGCSGAYADLSDDGQKAAYSTALAAKMAGSKVKIRFETDGVKYYAYCKIFQLTVMP